MAEPYAKSPYYSTNNEFLKYDIWVDLLSQDIATNTSSVRVRVWAWRTNNYTTDGYGTCYCNINGSSYSASWTYGQKPISYNSDTLLLDKTVTIEHDNDGSKSIYVEAKISHERFSSSWNGFTVALTGIPRKAEITNAPNFNDTDNPTITYKNPAGSEVTSLQACISLDGSTAAVAYRDIAKDGETYTFNLSSAERNTLLAATPNSSSLTVYFIVKTVLAGTTYTSVVSKTMTVISAAPTVGNIYYQDTNATTTAITGDNTQIVQNVSTVRFRLRDVTALKSATLVSATITINGVTVTSALTGTYINSKSVDFGTIDSSMNEKATIVITDSRGNTVSAEVTVTMLEWKLPTATINCNRKFNFYSETYLTINATYSSLDSHNTLAIQYRYKEVDAGTWGAWISAQSGVRQTITLDNTKEWNLQVKVSDGIGTTTYNIKVQLGLPILFIDKLKRSVSINGFPNEYNQLVGDRRLTVKNLSQEIVGDLWSKSQGTPGDPDYFSSSSLYLYDQNETVLTRATAYYDTNLSIGHGDLAIFNQNGKNIARITMSSTGGGHFSARDEDGNAKAILYASATDGGHLWLGNDNGDYIGGMWANNNGGAFELKNNSSGISAFLGTSGAGDGTLNLYDSSANNTINLSGEYGIVWCKKVRASEGVVELYDGSLSSGSTTFNYGNYNLYIVVGEVRSGGSMITMTVPKLLLSGSDQSFCISDEADYITFKMKYSSATATLTFGSRSSSGSILKVYGVN